MSILFDVAVGRRAGEIFLPTESSNHNNHKSPETSCENPSVHSELFPHNYDCQMRAIAQCAHRLLKIACYIYILSNLEAVYLGMPQQLV